MTKILDGRVVAQKLNKQTSEKVEALLEKGVRPTLAIMRADQNPASIQYERVASRFMKKVGIETEHVTFEDGVSEEKFLETLEDLNQDDAIHGILIMQPLPENIDRKTVSESISPEKDIDGMHPLNLGKIMVRDQNALLPSTVKAIYEMIRYYKIVIPRQGICVIGESNTVGKPLSVLLINQGATVTTCHAGTQDLMAYTKRADILISATGKIGLITAEHVKPNAIVIDVGFSFEGGKAFGDVKYDEVAGKASAITPVPGGVGSVTTASLALQLAQATEYLTKE